MGTNKVRWPVKSTRYCRRGRVGWCCRIWKNREHRSAVEGWRMNVRQCIRVNWLIATDTPSQTHCSGGCLCSTKLCTSRGMREESTSSQMTCVPERQWSGITRGWSCGKKHWWKHGELNRISREVTAVPHPMWSREQLVEAAPFNCYTSRRYHGKRIICLIQLKWKVNYLSL